MGGSRALPQRRAGANSRLWRESSPPSPPTQSPHDPLQTGKPPPSIGTLAWARTTDKHRVPNPMLRQGADRACYLAQWGRGGTLCSTITIRSVSNLCLIQLFVLVYFHATVCLNEAGRWLRGWLADRRGGRREAKGPHQTGLQLGGGSEAVEGAAVSSWWDE